MAPCKERLPPAWRRPALTRRGTENSAEAKIELGEVVHHHDYQLVVGALTEGEANRFGVFLEKTALPSLKLVEVFPGPIQLGLSAEHGLMPDALDTSWTHNDDQTEGTMLDTSGQRDA
jgi:hypothetical protein